MRYWLLLIFLFVTLCIRAQIQGTVAERQMQFGELNSFTLVLHSDKEASIDLSPLDQTPFQVISTSPLVKEAGKQTQVIEFTVLDTGEVWLPVIQAKVAQNTYFTDSIPLIVALPDSLAQNLNPIKSIVIEQINWWDIFKVALWIIGGILVIGLIWYFIRKKQPKKEPEPAPVIVIPPHITAMEQLESLKAKDLISQQAFKPYYSELTYILRNYLEGRFDIPALENTSDEIIANLKKNHINAEVTEQFAEIFRQVDLIKFAKATPSESMHQHVFDLVANFVKDTIPEENKEVSNG